MDDETYEEIEIQAPDIAIDDAGDTRPASAVSDMLTASRRRSARSDMMKAHVALMEREVIPAGESELFRLVKYHYRDLQDWHERHTGWHIQRGNSAVRLARHPSAITSGYIHANWKDPRDLACLTWILWYAENRQLSGRGSDQQFLLSQLAEQIQEQSANAMGEAEKLDFRKLPDRYSIRRALQYLEDLGGLQLVDGQTREWVEQTHEADVLYEFSDVIHALVSSLNLEDVLAAAPRINDRTQALEPALLVDETGSVSPLARAWRTLLTGPVLLRYDDPQAFAALKQHSEQIANELLDTFGWSLDINRDYACIVRGSGTATGPVSTLSTTGAVDQAVMLLSGSIRQQVASGEWGPPDYYGCLRVATEEITDLFYHIRERYGHNWGSTARDKSSTALLNEVYEKMRQIGLLRGPDAAGNVLVLPTTARYAVTYSEAGQEVKSTVRSRSKRAAKGSAEPLAIEWTKS
ncbi:MAG: TIGR02678 family protein [Ktedonobacteraceae bacterium]